MLGLHRAGSLSVWESGSVSLLPRAMQVCDWLSTIPSSSLGNQKCLHKLNLALGGNPKNG